MLRTNSAEKEGKKEGILEGRTLEGGGAYLRGAPLILEISLQFIAFFTAPFISRISRARARTQPEISHQYAGWASGEKNDERA